MRSNRRKEEPFRPVRDSLIALGASLVAALIVFCLWLAFRSTRAALLIFLNVPFAIIGGVVVAPQASELIYPIGMAVANRLTVDQVANTFSVYPSLTGSITEAARQLVRHDDLD